MPYIEMKTNTSLTKEMENELKSSLASALSSCFPGKTESWLMISFMPETEMYFAGSDAPCAMLEVSVFGTQKKSCYDEMTKAVCELIGSKCDIPADRIYVRYAEVDKWGWNGSNF